jgi:hypothetical protein
LLNFLLQQRKPLILIFIATYLYVVNGYWLAGSWMTPKPSKKFSWAKQFYRPALLLSNYLGVGGSRWTVFSPNVVHLSYYIYVVLYSDKQGTRIWTYPNSGRYLQYGETFREFSTQTRTIQMERELIKDLANYVVRMYDSANFYPSKVCVVRKVELIPFPTSIYNIRKVSKETVLFTYKIESQTVQ